MAGRKWKHNHVNCFFPPKHLLKGYHLEHNYFLAVMCGVKLTGEFKKCNFDSVNLRKAEFYDSQFYGCDFVGAWMIGARFRDVSFSACDFSGADFSQAHGLTTCTFKDDCIGLGQNRGVRATLDRKRGVYSLLPAYLTTASTQRKHMGPIHNSPEELIDPTPIPSVDHYRSPAAQIPKTCTDDIEYDDGYSYYLSGWYDDSKYKYGYKENAVLECPDIEEFRGCVRTR